MYGGQSTHIPIKVNLAGVIPIIFAMSIMMFPSTIIAFFVAPNSTNWFVVFFKNSQKALVVCYYICIIDNVLYVLLYYNSVQSY